MRIGIGYDVHRLTENRKLILGGIEIPYFQGLLGHSDADVLVHAIMDALLGAACLGDIGRHFPDTDNAYKNIDSLVLLKKTLKLIQAEGYIVHNLDATIVAQKPKLADYIDAMRARIADCIETDEKNINLKATTTETLGFEGRKEGISAHCVCLLYETEDKHSC